MHSMFTKYNASEGPRRKNSFRMYHVKSNDHHKAFSRVKDLVETSYKSIKISEPENGEYYITFTSDSIKGKFQLGELEIVLDVYRLADMKTIRHAGGFSLVSSMSPSKQEM
jgi:threonine synthase